MPTSQLGATDVRVSRLGLGTMTFGAVQREVCARPCLVLTAVSAPSRREKQL
jgi:aryl-alcohol dehydrogenase-like predicted oxidoreductase